MTTSELTTKDSNAIIKAGQDKPAIDVLQDRVILSLAVPLRNGAWEEYPKNYSVWKRKDGLYEQAQLLKEGEEIWVRWTEKPAQRGVYRDIVAIRAKGSGLPEAPAPTPPADESSEAIWESMGATKTPPTPQQPARAATLPTAAPVHGNGGNGAREWKEDYSRSKEALERERMSIESQSALKVASEILRDMLTTVDGTPESKLPIVKKLLPELTMIARAAIHEASQS